MSAFVWLDYFAPRVRRARFGVHLAAASGSTVILRA